MLALGAAVTAGCSGDISFSIGGQSIEDAAVELIEGDLAEGIGLGALEATCPEVADPAVGTEFDCTATTPDGAVIEFAGLVDREDHIDVQTTNVVVADAIGTFEAAGIDVINETEGTTLDASAMACGDSSIIIPDDGAIGCELTLPDTGEVYDAVYTINDLATGDFSLEWFPQG
jgi:hypothetical protein